MSEYVEMSSQLSNVVAIMDMDGFTINKKFYCKELALRKVGDVAAQSFFFNFGLRESDLLPNDKRTCGHVQTFIQVTHLPFLCSREGMKGFQLKEKCIVGGFMR